MVYILVTNIYVTNVVKNKGSVNNVVGLLMLAVFACLLKD